MSTDEPPRLCFQCKQPCIPTQADEDFAKEFPWTCAHCGLSFADEDPAEQALTLAPVDSQLLGVIRDKSGASYEVTAIGDAEWYLVSIQDSGERIGRVNLAWLSPPTMQLADLIIDPAYRNRGIGTALMPLIIDVTRRHALTLIRGFVVHKDIEATPHLLKWYERLGFTVESVVGDGHTAAWISMLVQ